MIDKIYDALLLLIEDYDPTILGKVGFGEAERIPAIEFGLPYINEIKTISDPFRKQLVIPMRILDQGVGEDLIKSLTDMYETFLINFEANFGSQLNLQGVSFASADISDFIPSNEDLAFNNSLSLSGSIIIEIKIE